MRQDAFLTFQYGNFEEFHDSDELSNPRHGGIVLIFFTPQASIENYFFPQTLKLFTTFSIQILLLYLLLVTSTTFSEKFWSLWITGATEVQHVTMWHDCKGASSKIKFLDMSEILFQCQLFLCQWQIFCIWKKIWQFSFVANVGMKCEHCIMENVRLFFETNHIPSHFMSVMCDYWLNIHCFVKVTKTF